MTRGIYRIGDDQQTLYVGQSIHAEKRLKDHRRALESGTHRNPYLQAVFNKHPDRFTEYEVVEEVEGEMFTREAFWIQELNSRCNLVIPGRDGWTWTDEARALASKSNSARWTEEERARISKIHRERIQKLSDEERRAMLGGMRGKEAWNKGKSKARDGLVDWKPGRKPGSIPWNKGKKNPKSAEAARKQAASLAARPLVACEHCGQKVKVIKRHYHYCKERQVIGT